MLPGRLSSPEFFARGGGISASERLECPALGPKSGDVEPILLCVYLLVLDSRPTHFLLEVSPPAQPVCPLSLILGLFKLASISDCAGFCGVQ